MNTTLILNVTIGILLFVAVYFISKKFNLDLNKPKEEVKRDGDNPESKGMVHETRTDSPGEQARTNSARVETAAA